MTANSGPFCRRGITRAAGPRGESMSIYEAVGLAWVIFTSGVATAAILFLAFVGFRTIVKSQQIRDDVPTEVKQMFKITR